VLIVPGAKDTMVKEGCLTTYTLRAPLVPGSKSYRFTFRSEKVRKILEQEKPDVLEFGCAYVMPYAGFRYHSRNRCAMVGFYHTDYPTAYVQQVLGDRLGSSAGERGKTWAQTHVRSIYNRFDLTFAPSHPLAEKLESIGVERVEYVPLGVDHATFHPMRRDPEFRESIGAGERDIVFIYAGRLDSEKRVDLILDAYERLCPAFPGRLLLMGEGTLKSRILEISKTHHGIHWMPYEKDRGRFARILASSDVYISAHPFETFGLSVAEAQASGLAVIGVNAGALRERVTESVGVLAEPDSVESMAACILGMSRNGYKEMGKRAREWSESYWPWERTFDTLFSHYWNLLREAV
jgi:alpha-1,6-mannosyltransferase